MKGVLPVPSVVAANVHRRIKMRLGFDLDEVVVNLTERIEIYVANNYGIDWPAECFSNYKFSECSFSSDENLNNRIIEDLSNVINDPDFQYEATPFDGAADVLYKMKRDGHKVFFVSARPKQLQPKTFKWLRANNIPFDKLYVIGPDKPKGLWGRTLKLDMYVDDLISNLESMYRYKKRWRKSLLLFDRPWNMGPIDPNKFKRVYNWSEILRHVGIQNR